MNSVSFDLRLFMSFCLVYRAVSCCHSPTSISIQKPPVLSDLQLQFGLNVQQV